MAGERYEAVIDSQGLVKSALICRSAFGTKHGLDRASAREPMAARFYDVRHAVPRAMHAVERNRLLTAKALGYPLQGPIDYGLRPRPDTTDSEPYAVLLTMTSRADKLWPQPQWVELGRALNIPIMLPWGSEAERALFEQPLSFRKMRPSLSDALGASPTMPDSRSARGQGTFDTLVGSPLAR